MSSEVNESTVSRLPQVNLERWGVHVRAALASGQSFRVYAREHGVSRHTLYAAQALMRQRGELPAVPSKSATAARRVRPRSAVFVPVRLPSSLSLTAQLPNGVRLQCEAADGEALRGLLLQLAALPCSV